MDVDTTPLPLKGRGGCLSDCLDTLEPQATCTSLGQRVSCGADTLVVQPQKRSMQMPYPAKKTPKLIEDVLSRIAQGETLAALGRELGFHPTSWSQWVREDEDLAIAYQRARDVGADVIAEDVLRIIDEEPERIVQIDEEGNKSTSRIDSAGVAWAKNRAEMRLKLLAKWNPKKYGDKQQVEVGNKEGEALKVESTADNAALALQLAEALRVAGTKDIGK